MCKCPLCESNRYIVKEIIKVEKLVIDYMWLMDILDHFNGIEEIGLYECVECGLVYFNPGFEGSDLFYRKLSEQPDYYMNNKSEFDYAIQKLIEINPERILEIGSGIGLFLDKIRNAFNVSAIETSSKAIEVLNEKGINLDDGNSKYDFIISFQVIEHISDVKSFLTDILYKLKSNGHLLLTMPNSESEYMREVYQILDYPPHHITRWNKKSLESIAKLFNLEVIDYYNEPIADIHYHQLIMQKIKKIKENVNDINLNIDYVINLNQNKISGHTHGILLKKI
jgi:2-polyprenyl-3-methyl-5-hydroxy-6-metoxy-1,4-benzoquinol methylase